MKKTYKVLSILISLGLTVLPQLVNTGLIPAEVMIFSSGLIAGFLSKQHFTKELTENDANKVNKQVEQIAIILDNIEIEKNINENIEV